MGISSQSHIIVQSHRRNRSHGRRGQESAIARLHSSSNSSPRAAIRRMWSGPPGLQCRRSRRQDCVARMTALSTGFGCGSAACISAASILLVSPSIFCAAVGRVVNPRSTGNRPRLVTALLLSGADHRSLCSAQPTQATENDRLRHQGSWADHYEIGRFTGSEETPPMVTTTG